MNRGKPTRATGTHLRGLLHVLEWTIDGHVEQPQTLLRETFEPGAREPFWDTFDFGVNR